jgi:hypothetical protein
LVLEEVEDLLRDNLELLPLFYFFEAFDLLKLIIFSLAEESLKL